MTETGVTRGRDTRRNDVEVAIAGFGPTGALAACLLGQHGLRTHVVDKARDVYAKPRAIAIDHEVMRHFDNIGIAEEIAPHVAPFPPSEHFGVDGQLIRRIDMVAAPYPLGYTPTMVFSQPPVEAALRARAAAFDSVRVELGTEVVTLHQTAGGVTLDLHDERGARRALTADYVIACDGASSTVREHVGLVLDDLDFDEPWLVVDVLIHDGAIQTLPKTAAQYCNPARPASYIVGPGRHRRWEIMLLPGEDPRTMELPENVWRLLAPWIGPEAATLWRAASYRFHALVAREWRRGRVVLAGDAAHQQPPFIGQGMCQGLRDAANLVWKLERVLRSRSDADLLDTYGAERGAHVRELTAQIKAIGQAICERDPAAAWARDARLIAEGGGRAPVITRQEIVPPLRSGMLALDTPSAGVLFPQPWVAAQDETGLLDRIAGTGWRLVLDGRHDAEALWPAGVRRMGGLDLTVIVIAPHDAPADVAEAHGRVVRERDGVVARWFDTHACRAAIVRPDHYVYGGAIDRAALAALMDTLATKLA
jgi:3-(3-hydroxy-phenyl)propionate hydroxylase